MVMSFSATLILPSIAFDDPTVGDSGAQNGGFEGVYVKDEEGEAHDHSWIRC
jgi:hypothetical protein